MARANSRPAEASPSSLKRRTKPPPAPTNRNGASNWDRLRNCRWSDGQRPSGCRTAPHLRQPCSGRHTKFRRQVWQSSSPGAPHAAQAGGRTTSKSAAENSRHWRRSDTRRRFTWTVALRVQFSAENHGDSQPSPIAATPGTSLTERRNGISRLQRPAEKGNIRAPLPQVALSDPALLSDRAGSPQRPGRAIRRARSADDCFG